MPDITVEIRGLEEFRRRMASVPGATRIALQVAAAGLAREGTGYWRSLVAVRTGRMRGALAVHVETVGGVGVVVRYHVNPDGYYYRFQRRGPQWSKQVAAFLANRAQDVISAELQRAMARI